MHLKKWDYLQPIRVGADHFFNRGQSAVRPGPRFQKNAGPRSALVRFFKNFAGPRPVRSADRTGSLGPRGPTFRSVDPCSDSLKYDMMVARSNNPPKKKGRKSIGAGYGQDFDPSQCPFYWSTFYNKTLFIRDFGWISQNWRLKITIMEFRGVLWRFIVLK